MNIDQYTKMFESLNPAESLDSISGKADDLIKTGKMLLSGGGKIPFC